MKEDATEVGGNGAVSAVGFSVQDRYLNKREVAELLGVSPRTVDNFMRRGWLVYRKIGRTVRFRLNDVHQHLDKKARVCR